MAVKRKYRINLKNYGNPPAIMVSQYDEGYALEFEVYEGALPASGLNVYDCKLKGTRPQLRSSDPPLSYEFTGTVSGALNNIISFVIDTTMTGSAGKGVAEIAIIDTTNDVKFASFNMDVFVEKAAVPDDAIDADVERAQEIAEQVQEIVDNAAATVKGEAEAWAVGQRDGVDVPSTDPAYENNAKFYAEQAAQIAEDISGVTDQVATNTNDISDLKENLINYNTFDILKDLLLHVSHTSNGATFTWTGDTCVVTGTNTTAEANDPIITFKTTLPAALRPGMYPVIFRTDNPNIFLNVLVYDSSDNTINTLYANRDSVLLIPVGAVKFYARIVIKSGVNPAGTVSKIAILTYKDNAQLETSVINGFLSGNAFNILSQCMGISQTSSSIEYVWNTDGSCIVKGTATALSFSNIYVNANRFPTGMKAGGTYRLKYASNNVSLQVYTYKNGAIVTPALVSVKTDTTFTIPADSEGVIIRLSVSSGTTVNETVKPLLYTETLTNDELYTNSIQNHIGLPNNTDLDTITENGFWVLSAPNYTYTNSPLPSGVAGLLVSYISTNDIRTQVIFSMQQRAGMWIRSRISTGWKAWTATKDSVRYELLVESKDLDDQDIQTVAVDEGNNTVHSPLSGTAAYVFTFGTPMMSKIQYWVAYVTGRTFYRRYEVSNNVWGDWIELKYGNTYNNTYTTQHYENTYNIDCTPTITTDTNNFLASTGDTTDRTSDIQTMLNTTGVCRLGPGVFYVTGVEVPNYGALIGSGKNTKLILASSVTAGYAVKLKTYSTVKDMSILGATADITPSSTVGTRHGILFEGTADAQSSPQTFYRSYITGCLIRNFAGGGITCYNTGLSASASLVVSDCQMRKCDAGINVSYFSEFHRWTNIMAQECYYGCICNGGNNNFANCDFSGNKQALLIDNSTNQSRNNTHGTFSACTFHHSDNTYNDGAIVSVGTCMQILGASAGEIFTGCQIGYGDLEIDNSKGIRFDACNFLRMTALEITDSPLVVFSDCNFWDATSSPLTQSGNTTLKFHDCYLLTNGVAFDPMAS